MRAVTMALTLTFLAGCTAQQSRRVLSVAPLESDRPQPPQGRVIADFESADATGAWTKYVVEGSVHDPVATLEQGALRITSDSSAGLFWHACGMDPAREPLLRWRWRVSETFGTSTPLSPEFDNFPARLLVGFDAGWEGSGPAAAAFRKKVRDYTGFDPPSRAICYTFGGKLPASEAVDGAFGEGRIVVVNLRPHTSAAGQWYWQVRDVAADYRAIFGTSPPRVMAIAVGSDSHRLKKPAWGEFDDITAFGPEAAAHFVADLAAPELDRRAPPLVWWIAGLCMALAAATAGWWVWQRSRA
ncbi:MAG: DUF3047 domain-containing protein [Planctomycetes bacterium]|nr:DUF3047 domain-containing protein [Planctomycetota bacterium]